MKKALFFSLLFAASVLAIEPRELFQYLPITPFLPPERPSRDYLQLDGPYAPWRATAPIPVWTEVALYRERVDEMRKLEDNIPVPQDKKDTAWGLPPVDTNIVITVPDIGIGRKGQTVDEPMVIDTDWFYIPKSTTSKSTSQATPGSSSEFNKTPIPMDTNPNQPTGGVVGVAPNTPTPPSSKVEYKQPDERAQ